jgi:hypothetical protein
VAPKTKKIREKCIHPRLPRVRLCRPKGSAPLRGSGKAAQG